MWKSGGASECWCKSDKLAWHLSLRIGSQSEHYVFVLLMCHVFWLSVLRFSESFYWYCFRAQDANRNLIPILFFWGKVEAIVMFSWPQGWSCWRGDKHWMLIQCWMLTHEVGKGWGLHFSRSRKWSVKITNYVEFQTRKILTSKQNRNPISPLVVVTQSWENQMDPCWTAVYLSSPCQ